MHILFTENSFSEEFIFMYDDFYSIFHIQFITRFTGRWYTYSWPHNQQIGSLFSHAILLSTNRFVIVYSFYMRSKIERKRKDKQIIWNVYGIA